VLVAAAVCPHPPLLIPEAMGAAGLAGQVGLPADRAGFAGDPMARSGAGSPQHRPGSDEDLWMPALQAACGAAVAGLAAAGPDLIAAVGGAARTAQYDLAAAGSLRSFGIPFTTGPGEPVLPLSLTVGSWLLQRYLAPEADRHPGFHDLGKVNHADVLLQAVRQSLPTASCLRMGAGLAARAARVALLVMGDGSARRAAGVPGAADPAAEGYDADAAAAFADADPGRLARLDCSLDGELMVAGRAAWQVLAGAADGSQMRGRLRFAAAPLGVGYLVASWTA
jgi:hypothetical protein